MPLNALSSVVRLNGAPPSVHSTSMHSTSKPVVATMFVPLTALTAETVSPPANMEAIARAGELAPAACACQTAALPKFAALQLVAPAPASGGLAAAVPVPLPTMASLRADVRLVGLIVYVPAGVPAIAGLTVRTVAVLDTILPVLAPWVAV